MQRFYAKKSTYYILQFTLAAFLVLLSWYVWHNNVDLWAGTTMMASTVIIVIAGIVGGVLFGLGLSLLCIFLIGTFIFWKYYVSDFSVLSVSVIMTWMLFILIAAVLSGVMNRWIVAVLTANQEMNQRFDDLVTIDPLTGFDNEKRFYFDLEDEFKRSARTNAPFSLLLIQVKHLKDFERLYGGKESQHLLATIARRLREHTRMNDRKFRYRSDIFAIILVNTPVENVPVVMDKITPLLERHTLLKGIKQISLTLAYGMCGYSERWEEPMELIQYAKKELDQYIH